MGSTSDISRERPAAFLFADVKGYSVLIQRDEVGTYARLRRARLLFRQLVGDYGGWIVDEAGDGVLAEFADGGRAVDFALAIQRDLANAAAWQGESGPFAFRIGIHLGPVHRDGDRPYGHSLIVAQRIQEIAPPGRVCISDPTRAAVAGRTDLRFVNMGMRVLKNIDPMPVHRVEAIDQAYVAEPMADSPNSPGYADDSSIAMLPLENHSMDISDRMLCDGVTVDIIDRLSRFRDLSVIARHSAFQCRGLVDRPAEIGQLLGARYLALGSMQRSGDRLRITVQLIEAETGRLLWSERYDGCLSDVFAFQDDVAAMVAARLASQVSVAERRRILAAHHPFVGCYGLVLRGQDLLFRYRRDSNSHARRLFEEATVMDPSYARPYVGASRALSLAWRYRWTDSDETSLTKAVELAQTAIEHDENDARGFAEIGFANLQKRRHDAALEAYGRAVVLNPNDADILAELGDALICSGQPEEALHHLERAIRLNPRPPDWYLWNLGGALFDLSRYDDVVKTVSKMVDPTEGQRLLAASCAYLGRTEEAARHAQAVLNAHPTFSTAEWRRKAPFRSEEALDHFLTGLRLAGLP